jgi:hypothetical protein
MQRCKMADVRVQFLPRQHVGFIQHGNRLANGCVGRVGVYSLYLVDTATQGAAAQPIDSTNSLNGGLGDAIGKSQLKIFLQVGYECRHGFSLSRHSHTGWIVNTL